MIDHQFILTLTDLINLPEAERVEPIKALLASKSKDEVAILFATLLNVADQYAKACDEAVWLHLVQEGIHPYSIEKLITPSLHGALNGLILADKAKNQDICCESCAYRRGTLANSCLTTQANVAYAIKDEHIFYCHKDIENLDCPTSDDRKRMKPCKGWAQHVNELKHAKSNLKDESL
jgi:hypothetical protein